MKKTLCIFLILLLLLCLVLPAGAASPDAPATQETEPSEPVGTGETTEPPVTTEPTEPTEPTVPTEPSESTEPTEPEPEPRPDEYHRPFMSGKNDGGFHPQDSLTRAELCLILYTQGSYEPGPSSFPDVRPGAWYAAAVNALAASGLLTGYSDGSFRPTKPITRAELAAILAKLRGETPEELAPFYDIRTHWAREGISLAYAKGWVSGYPDGSFRPNNRVTRAEAAVMLTKFLDRRPDLAAIAAGEGLRFFPDVKTGSWYYNAVMEAATDHSAHFETPEADEQWLNPKPSPYSLKDGFYCFGRNLFAVEGGSFVRSAGSRSLNGVSYSCAGDSGVCSARTEVLKLASGELILLHGGRPLAAPGGYADGFWLKAGQLYASVDGHILRKAAQGSFQGVAYTCTGESGVCTVADWRPLALEGVSLSVFDAQLTPEAAASGSGTATVLETLRAAVRVYERYFQVEYPLESKTDQDWINKALEYEILVNRRSDYDQPVKRGDAAVFLQRALRGRELKAINEIADIPDVSKNSFYYPYLMCLYNAGVMQGVGTQHKADIYNTLPRSELAKLLTRLERRTERLRFALNEKIIESIQYGTSGSGKYPLTAWRLGDGKNVMVLTFAIHGWEDNWARDGQELVYLADQTKSWLESHYELLRDNDWTVYILRCLNPDGLYLGTTCNGPGRCTTTYYNASGQLVSGKGIDMNRSFPYKFKSYTDSRNFNGSAPLSSPEAKAIAAFIRERKGSGYNLCIDTHGWYGQIICSSGKGTIYNAFAQQFPSSRYTSLSGAAGYLTGWAAYVLGYDACLLELPRGITSHSAFLNAGCVWRYENAISYLLQHYKGPNATRDPKGLQELELDGN